MYSLYFCRFQRGNRTCAVDIFGLRFSDGLGIVSRKQASGPVSFCMGKVAKWSVKCGMMMWVRRGDRRKGGAPSLLSWGQVKLVLQRIFYALVVDLLMKRNNRELSQRCAGLRMQICQMLCPARGRNELACAQPQATIDDHIGAPFWSCNQETLVGDQRNIPKRSAHRVLALMRHVKDVKVVDHGGRMQLQAPTARPLPHTLPNSTIPEVPRNYCH